MVISTVRIRHTAYDCHVIQYTPAVLRGKGIHYYTPKFTVVSQHFWQEFCVLSFDIVPRKQSWYYMIRQLGRPGDVPEMRIRLSGNTILRTCIVMCVA